jgi:hypothetical protein
MIIVTIMTIFEKASKSAKTGQSTAPSHPAE